MKRLYRSNTEKKIGGVCGGFAEYFDIDPVIVRLIWLAAALSGIGVLAYGLALIMVPMKTQ